MTRRPDKWQRRCRHCKAAITQASGRHRPRSYCDVICEMEARVLARKVARLARLREQVRQLESELGRAA